MLNLTLTVTLLEQLRLRQGVDSGADDVWLRELPLGGVVGMELAGFGGLEKDVGADPAVFAGLPGREEGLDVSEAESGPVAAA